MGKPVLCLYWLPHRLPARSGPDAQAGCTPAEVKCAQRFESAQTYSMWSLTGWFPSSSMFARSVASHFRGGCLSLMIQHPPGPCIAARCPLWLTLERMVWLITELCFHPFPCFYISMFPLVSGTSSALLVCSPATCFPSDRLVAATSPSLTL